MTSTTPPHHQLFASYQEAFKFFNNGILWLDDEGMIIGANEKLSSYLQFSIEELKTKNIFEIAPHLNLIAWKNLWKSLLKSRHFQTETEYITADDLLVPVSINAVMLRWENERWALLVVEPLMESQRLKDLLKVTTKAGKVGGWELDMVKESITTTGEIQKLLGLNTDISVHQTDEFLKLLAGHVSNIELADLKERIQFSIKNGTSFETELLFENSEGEFLRLLLNGFTQQSELNQTIKLYGAVKDISNLEAKNEDLQLTQFTIEHANEMIFWVRPDGTFQYINRAVCDRLGYTKDELMSQSSKLINVRLEGEQREYLWAKLRKERYVEHEGWLKAKDGTIFPIFATLNYIKFKNEEFACVFTVDNTERKKEEERLKLAHFALKNVSEMVLWVDEAGKILFANEEFCRKTGYTKDETREISVFALYNKGTPKQDRKNLWKSLRENKKMELETDLVLKNGDTIPVLCNLNYINYEGKEIDCLFMRDLRRKKIRDEQLSLAQKTFETASELIFWVDEEGIIQFTNNAASETLGYSPKALSDKSFWEICQDSKIKEGQQRLIDTETLLKKKSGSPLPVALSRSKMVIDGRLWWCLIARDISERKSREAELEVTRKKVEELSLRLKEENILLREEIQVSYNFNNIITSSTKYRQVLNQAAQVADSNATVLILGETGTGKELLARAIHSLSPREKSVMVKVNCAALPENLIESELFGHEKGAFTGATQQKKGRFEMANGGTIFLDEIGEMPLELQAKLLRVLQEGEFERLGGTQTLKVNVRVIAATNRNLEKMVQEGMFREDLYYRLNVFPIFNLPLRERKEDIPILVKFFAKKFGEQQGRKIEKILQADLELLKNYSFPGNIRELENMIERAVILSKGDTLNLSASINLNQSTEPGGDQRFLSFEDMQRTHIIDALKRTGGRVTGPSGAGRLLKLNDRTLASKMRKLGINREDFND